METTMEFIKWFGSALFAWVLIFALATISPTVCAIVLSVVAYICLTYSIKKGMLK